MCLRLVCLCAVYCVYVFKCVCVCVCVLCMYASVRVHMHTSGMCACEQVKYKLMEQRKFIYQFYVLFQSLAPAEGGLLLSML